MLDERALVSYIERIDAVARRYNCVAKARIGKPASGAEIALCESRIRRSLTPSHRAFLECANGFSIEVIERSEFGFPHPVGVHEFFLWSTSELIERSELLRGYFAGFDVGNARTSSTDELVRRYVDVAAFEYEDAFTLMDFSRASSDGEAPIIYVLEYEDDWIEDAVSPVAASFGEFAERCLKHMIETESDFRFWIPRERFDWWRSAPND